METHAQARRTLELDLRHALESKAFELFYQPLVNLKTGQILTCEALLRWPHRDRGMIYPAESFPLPKKRGSSSKSPIRLCTRPAWSANDGRAILPLRSTSHRSSSTVPMFLHLLRRSRPQTPPTHSRLR